MADGGGDAKGERARAKQRGAKNTGLAFAKIPNEVILEGGLSPAALRLLAYRLTKVGDFVLHRTDVEKQIGMNKGTFYKAVAQLGAKGLIERNQHRGAHPHKRVSEKLHVRVLRPDSSGYASIWLKLIRILEPAALAVYLLLLAHWPKRQLYAREVREHFGWSDTTVQKWMTYLIYHGLIGEFPRRKNGDFAGSVYAPAVLSADEIGSWCLRDGKASRPAERRIADRKNPEAVSGPRLADASLTEPHSADAYLGPSLLTKNFLPTPNSHSALSAEGGGAGGEDGRDATSGVTTWLDELKVLAPKRFELWSSPLQDDEGLEACRDLLDDSVLRIELWRVTDARIGGALLSSVGLDDYRRIVVASAIIAAVDSLTAHNYLLSLIQDRIGSDRRKSLNSWRWTLKTLLDRVRQPGDIDECSDDESGIPF